MDLSHEYKTSKYEDLKKELEKEGLVWFGLFGFMAYQPLQVIQCQIHFYVSNLFYWK